MVPTYVRKQLAAVE